MPNIFVVNAANVPAKNLKEFVALAKAKPGQLTYGSAGNGSAGHLAFEYLKLRDRHRRRSTCRTRAPARRSPTCSAAAPMRASAGTPPLMPHIKSGKIRAIAVGTPKRITALPDVPTVAEQGYKGFETSQWYGIIGAREDARAGHQAPARRGGESDEDAGGRASASPPTTRSRSAPRRPSSPPSSRKSRTRWSEVVKKANIKAE